MKVVQLVAVLLAVVAGGRAGLLRVPRVYNALISTNQRLAPSRADTVSLPVVGPVALLPAAAIVAEEAAPPPAAKNASEAEAAANHTAAALVAPLAVYSPYYYSAYSYHYNPYLVPPLLHYGYNYLPLPLTVPVPLAVAHAAPAPPAADTPDQKGGGDAKADADKEAVTVEAN
ncbi:uncharacterized protein LOC126190671 [Schistocerca cancellata]|uniref:uncharacterized protein LOC126190671 n=1 Tax=Schistocerca cancellata TaxID=274614 RepID=UPI002118198E|nr:uncharacterized protein LOC126190671 [Schistocerca cancellata]